jgi:hypothetical protein
MTNPICLITTQELMRHTMIGTRAGDPVLPERSRHPRRRPRSRTTRSR